MLLSHVELLLVHLLIKALKGILMIKDLLLQLVRIVLLMYLLQYLQDVVSLHLLLFAKLFPHRFDEVELLDLERTLVCRGFALLDFVGCYRLLPLMLLPIWGAQRNQGSV